MKNPHAVALGRLGGRKGGAAGGHARARGLSAERRKEIACSAAASRWKGRLPESLRPILWTHPTTFESLNLEQDLNLVMYQVLAHGGASHKAWLVRRFGD